MKNIQENVEWETKSQKWWGCKLENEELMSWAKLTWISKHIPMLFFKIKKKNSLVKDCIKEKKWISYLFLWNSLLCLTWPSYLEQWIIHRLFYLLRLAKLKWSLALLSPSWCTTLQSPNSILFFCAVLLTPASISFSFPAFFRPLHLYG